MDSIRYKRLYNGYLDGVKQVSANQYKAKCPFHSDKNPSFTFNDTDGLYFCFAGCGGGNAYQFAERVGEPDPAQYINGSNFTAPPKIEPVPDFHNMSGLVDTMTNELKPEHIPNCWDMDVAKDMDVGYSNSNFHFTHHDINGNLIAVHEHRGKVIGIKQSKWYMIHKVKGYDTNKPIYIAEGEKDAVTLFSQGKQVVSNTTGCQSIPKGKDGFYDLSFLKKFKEIYIAYDNDDAGRKGAERLGTEIISKPPYPSVKIIQWDKSLPTGYDVTDAYSIDDEVIGHPFLNACMDARVLEPRFKGFKVVSLTDFMDTEYKEIFPVIRYMLYSDNISILAGETGAGKSMCALQMGCSIASGTPVFGEFEVTKQKVMMIQFENENADMKSRLQKMIPYFINRTGSKDWMNDFDLLQVQADDELFSDNWKKIEDTLIERNFRDGVLIVDNMYTSTDKEIQNNSEMSALLKEIFRIKKLYGLTMLLIAHPNKGVNIEKDLSVDQIQGGKTLTNSVSNVMQLHTSSTSVDLRIMKITKAGRTEHNDLHNIPFKLKWDDSTCTFERGAIIKDITHHFEAVTERWELKLLKEVYGWEEMQMLPHFNREQFRDKIPEEYSSDEKSITRLFVRLQQWGYMKKVGHNQYQFVKDELDEIMS